jgi:hypothetical protein
MPRYAHFDPTTGAILNWMDTDAFSYASIPTDDHLLALTDEQYDARDSAGPLMVKNGALSAYVAPPPAAPVVPTSISPAQARLALLDAGLLDQVEAAVAAGSRATQIAWEMATSIERNSPTVAALSAALGLTDTQLDDLFTTAAAIRV